MASLPLLPGFPSIAKLPLSTRVFPSPSMTASSGRRHVEFGEPKLEIFYPNFSSSRMRIQWRWPNSLPEPLGRVGYAAPSAQNEIFCDRRVQHENISWNHMNLSLFHSIEEVVYRFACREQGTLQISPMPLSSALPSKWWNGNDCPGDRFPFDQHLTNNITAFGKNAFLLLSGCQSFCQVVN